jgi:predicted transglutaminase-like cysteine proteinase
MANGGTVTVDFAVEIERANSGITQIIGRLEGFERQLGQLNRASERHLRNVENRFESLDKIVRRATQAFSLVVVGQLVKSAADAADEFGKLADKLGVSTDQLKAFQIAAEDAGVSAEATNKVLIDAQKRLGEAALGTGEAAKFIKILGLNVQELQRLSPDELFKVYSESISKLSSRSEQLAAATALMGKSASEAFNLIQAGSPAIDEAAEFVDKFALALDRVSIKQIEQANDAINRLQLISKSGLQQFVAGLAPFVEELSRRIQEATGSTEGLKAAGAVAGATLQTALDLATNAANSAKAAFFGLVSIVQTALADLIEFSIKAHTLLNTREFFFSPEVQKQLAIGIENATGAIRLSANQNLASARDSLSQIKTIEQIQAGIVAAMEASRQRAEQAVAEQTARDGAGGGISLGLQDLALTWQQQADLSTEAAQLAAEEQKRIFREVTAEFEAEIKRRNDLESKASDERLDKQLKAEAELRAAKAQTTDLAIGLLQALGTKNKAFAIAAIVLEKAIAIQRLLLANHVAAELAFASQLVPGVPATLATAAAAKAAVLSQGLISAGLIAATGVLQIADVTSGGGRSAPGTALNPAFVTTPAGASGQAGATSQSSVQVIIAHNVGFDQRVMDQIIAGIREATDDRDVIIFGPDSRQAKEIVGG